MEFTIQRNHATNKNKTEITMIGYAKLESMFIVYSIKRWIV